MNWRFKFIFLFFIASFLGIWLKLFYWQVIKSQELSDLGLSQYVSQFDISPKRGDILASDGFPLSTNKVSYILYANPKEVKEKDKTSQILSSLTKVDSASISANLALDREWVVLKNGIDNNLKEEVEKMKLDGIGFQETQTRFYPEASLAASLIGFVGKDSLGLNKGYFGLEGYYDRQLQGRIDKVAVIRDAFGKPVFAKLKDNSSQQDGRSIQLNIDRVIQFLTDKKLKEGIDLYGAESGMAVVMDPKTGNVIAMSSFPNFDPSTYWNFDENLYKNPLILDTYEPGSTFKPIVMSAALDAGVITPKTTCTICSGPVKINDYEIHTWNNEYFNNINMIDVMIHSDNTGMVFVSQKLGLDRMLSYFKKFGLGSSTGVDLQGEFYPDLKEKDSWYPIDVATASFGQGISVTPIQLLDAFSSIANNGIRMEPHVVQKIITSDGKEIPIAPKELERPISPETAKIMTEILVNTVNKGEANWARIKGYKIAGKTGTASIPLAGHYDPSKTIASFIGFAPADDPKFVMLVILNKPTTSIYGAETAAPIFFSIAQDILNYYHIAPSVSE